MENFDPLNVPDELDEYGDPKQSGSDPEPEETDDTEEVDDQEETEVQDEPEEDDSEPEEEDEEPEQEQEKKPKGEKNSFYAEQRRQKEQQQRDQLMEQIRRESPEFQVAQTLANMYGIPVDQLQQRLQEAQIARQAKEQNVPVEVMKRQFEADQKVNALQQQLLTLQFQGWKNRVESEAAKLKQDFPMLTDDDMQQAQNHLLTVIRNPDMPLEEAVMAVHGRKILNALREKERTEALAEVSGRKKGALPPKSSKTADTKVLTEDQRAAAKLLGMSEAEYIKWSVD